MTQFNRYRIGKYQLNIYEHASSLSAGAIHQELLQDCYGVDRLTFNPSDRIIDVGGHVGMFSILMALRHPHTLITTYEAYPPNFELLLHNLQVNQIENVWPYNKAVTGHGSPVKVTGRSNNSGGASIHTGTGDLETHTVESNTLDDIIQGTRCNFLKLDCEGSEYDILNNFTKWPQVRQLGGEFHINQRLAGLGYSPQTLLAYCAARTGIAAVKFCRMDD